MEDMRTFNESPYEIRTITNQYFSSPLDEMQEIPASEYLKKCQELTSEVLVISRKYMGVKVQKSGFPGSTSSTK